MVKIHKKIKPKNPIMVAAWPGMGNVALKSATYLKDRLKAQVFAEIEAEDFFIPNEAWIDNGLISLPSMPEGKFYFWENKTGEKDIIIFISQAQTRPEKNQEYVSKILEVAKNSKVDTICTFAAMPVPIDHLKKPEVLAATTNKKLIEKAKKISLKTMSKGQISGLNGLFLALAKEVGFSGICMLAEIPLYTIQIENPRASLAIVETFTKFAGIHVDLNPLRLQARLMQDEIEKLIDYLKTPEDELTKPISEEEIEKLKNMLAAQERIPDSAKKKIEEFFGTAGKDIAKAPELKKELDKWGVYREYEDRFLDLFKKKQKRGN